MVIHINRSGMIGSQNQRLTLGRERSTHFACDVRPMPLRLCVATVDHGMFFLHTLRNTKEQRAPGTGKQNSKGATEQQGPAKKPTCQATREGCRVLLVSYTAKSRHVCGACARPRKKDSPYGSSIVSGATLNPVALFVWGRLSLSAAPLFAADYT